MKKRSAKNIIITVLAMLVVLIGYLESDRFMPAADPANALRVSFLDVGQGDSIFIQLPNRQTMLIDAGNAVDGEHIVSYIRDLGYERIDYLIATHPHADHIGGMREVVQNLAVGEVYMPKVAHTSKTYEDLLTAIAERGLKIHSAKAGVSLLEQDGLQACFVAPTQESYEDLNNYSAVLHLVYGQTAFLFTGDAEAYSESLIDMDVSADVLKMGHHGSSTSSSQEFLNRVDPSIAVICCGQDNSYGHPHRETLQALAAMDVAVYRTDRNGRIEACSDGKTVTVAVQKEELQ